MYNIPISLLNAKSKHNYFDFKSSKNIYDIIIYKVVKYRKIVLIYIVYTSENIKSYIFTPQECTYIFLDYL